MGILAACFVANTVYPFHGYLPTSRRKYSAINLEKNSKGGSSLGSTKPRAGVTNGTLSFSKKLRELNVLVNHSHKINAPLSRVTPVLTSEQSVVLRQEKLPDAIQDSVLVPGYIHGIFWSNKAEDSIQREHRDISATELAKMTRETSVIRMVPGCGHSQNRLLTFQNGCQVCCRYRNSLDLIQGEIYAYSLSQILHIQNLPPTTVGVINATGSQWDAVRTNMTGANWLDGHRVIFSQWIPNLVPAFLPKVFQKLDNRLHPPDIIGLGSASEISQLVQWSDMIVLDYLTGNMDRMVNMLVNQRWNSFIMDSPVHNLEQSMVTGQLYFLDNELSFIHSYRLLYRYGHFHAEMLRSLCVFRLSTVDNLKRLQSEGNIWERMWDFAVTSDLLESKQLPRLSRKNIDILKSRLSDVLNQVKSCQKMYPHEHRHSTKFRE
ncbi:extracellular serine/threonine protein kinase four-jointed-like [Patiria miniata]|uniref:Uncharacterized protein n=1 Tax=Patiria miniata TaxID=46514 RepID=A0A914BEY5_PATMI|nr:extracellular serine/threonine protein kinase four-jointed-like [Patiria miniata]